MKYLLALLLLTAPALAEGGDPLAPAWEEFCPKPHLKDDPTSWVPRRKYWGQRKIAFEKTIETCNSAIDKATCYMQIRQIETTKTEGYNTRRAIDLK